jgi:5'-nucleotidase
MTGRRERLDDGEGTDIKVLSNGYASLTPIQYDLTAYRLLEDVKEIEL